MEFTFSKYSGCGNDFILIDDRNEFFPLQNKRLIAGMCHRQKGIGADGVILLQKSTKANYRMRIFNPDGSEAEMCGNGIRCLLKFIQEHAPSLRSSSIETLHRIHRVAADGDLVSAEMGDPQEIRWELELLLREGPIRLHSLNTGVPHAVEFVEDLASVDLLAKGLQVRHHASFAPKGTNYNAVEITAGGMVALRTFERGVEGETLACGTGATAAALAAAKVAGLKSPVEVVTQSGEVLKIYFEMITGNPKQVWMAGPARKVFSGRTSFCFS